MQDNPQTGDVIRFVRDDREGELGYFTNVKEWHVMRIYRSYMRVEIGVCGFTDLGYESNQTFVFRGNENYYEFVRKANENDFRKLYLSRYKINTIPFMNIGADPEMFLFSEGKVIPSWKVLPSKSENAAIFWDGVQGEFTTEPTYCHELFLDKCHARLNAIMMQGVNYKGYKDLTFDPKTTVVKMTPEIFKAATSDKHLALGCMPSKNVYGIPGCEGIDGRDLMYRFSGCHLHYGVGKVGIEGEREIIKALDQIGGVMITSMFEGYENPVRRRYYGKAGEYRTPAHGIEWRVPSSVIYQHPGLFMLVLDVCRAACKIGLMGMREKFWACSDEEGIEVLMGYDAGLARKVLDRNRKALMDLLKAIYRGCSEGLYNVSWNVIYDGVKKVCPSYMEDAVKNWRIGQGWESCTGSVNCKWSDLAFNL